MKSAPTFICEGCGKETARSYFPAMRVFNKRQRFCTVQCSNKSRGKSNLDATFVCQRCGKISARSKRSDNDGLDYRQRFCSKSCSAQRPRNVVSNGFVHARYGYRYFSDKGKWIAEHRRVMEAILGRPLRKGETVHHKNGNRLDNRPENLELWAKNHGPGARVADQVEHAKKVLALYNDGPFNQSFIEHGRKDVQLAIAALSLGS